MPKARDRSEGRRPLLRARGAPGEEIAERRARSLEEPLDFRRLPGWFVRLEVRNPMHGTHYHVLLPTYPSREAAMCTCTDFSRSGLGTCKHVEAALRWIAAHPSEVADPQQGGPPISPSWEEVDQRIRSVPPDASPVRRMTWAGRVLVEEPRKEEREKEGVVHRGGRGSRA